MAQALLGSPREVACHESHDDNGIRNQGDLGWRDGEPTVLLPGNGLPPQRLA